MSDKLYAIKGSTLTALGDAIRNKAIGTTELPTLTTSFEMNYGVGNGPHKSRSFHIDRVSKIKAIINITWADDGRLNMPIWVAPGVFEGKYNAKPTDAIILPKDETEFPYEVIIEGTDIGFGVNQGNGFNTAYIEVELIGLDENGNEFKYTPLEMIDVIDGLIIMPNEALNLTGSCQYRFSYNGSNWLIDEAGDKITTNNITDASYMFYQSGNLREIPFEINMANNAKIEYMFANSGIKEAPKVNLTCSNKINFSNLFNVCSYLRELPEWLGDLMEQSYNIPSGTIFGPFANMVYSCRSLRKIPDKVMKYMDVSNPSGYYYVASYGTPFRGCYCLDELVNITCDNYAFTSNQFNNYFGSLSRVKDITFATNEDGTPFTRTWKNQTLSFTDYVGYFGPSDKQYVTKYNSGITADKEVKDDATYQALKNDEDWFSGKLDYSRYNHDSAVNTINSLPDVSSGSANTIKFMGQSGALTDGGAINTLTEEEIAVATAKGWTVTLV